MNKSNLMWIPRTILIFFILFISLFSLDTFTGSAPFLSKLGGLIIHLIPSFILIAMLVILWRRYIIGGIAFTIIGVLFTIYFNTYKHITNFLILSFPLIFAGTLFVLFSFITQKKDTLHKNIDFGFVADIYDDYVNVDFDIPFYKSLCKGHSSILELMCGTGRVSLPLIEAGINLTCVDYSQEMLDVFAKKLKGRKVDLLCQDICELNINKKFDFIFIPFNSLSEITEKEKRKLAIEKVFEHLADNGDFLITLYNPAYRLKSVDGNLKCLGKFDIADNRTLIVTCYNSYDQANDLVYGTQFYEVYDNKNKLVDKRFLNISFSIISKDELIGMSAEAGFTFKGLYGDYNFGEFNENSMFMNFLFTKQATTEHKST